MKLLRSPLAVAAGAAAALMLSLGVAAHAAPSKADELRTLRQQEKQRTEIYKAFFPDLATARKAAISFHDNLLEAHYEQGFLVMELQPGERAALSGFGFRFERADEFIAQRNAMIDAIQAAADAREKAGGRGEDSGINSIPGFSCYETVEETFADAQALVAAHPTLASWKDVGDSWQKTNGLGGYDMNVLKITNSAVPGPKPILFINSAIHAREYATAPLNTKFAHWLLDGYGTNADATWIVDHHEVHLMLQTNPDGRKMAEAGLSWRKNTNTAYCSPTSNHRGADLNRNFTFTWNTTGGAGSSGNQCDDTYRGPTAHSEPETQAVEAYIRSLWPDRRGTAMGDPAPADTSGVHIDIHSYADLVLWPWGETTAPTGNAAAFTTMGRRLAYYNGYTPEQSIGLYPTDGTTDSPSYGELGVAAFTIELGNAFFESCSHYSRVTEPKNLPALIYAAKVVRAPYETPSGPDVTSVTLSGKAASSGVTAGTPVKLTAAITDTQFNNSNGVEPVQNVVAAEAYVDVPPWVTGARPIPLTAVDGQFNTPTEQGTAVLGTRTLASGKHIVFVRGQAASGQFGPVTASLLVIK